ncbi:MAG: hypothetical protein AAGF11_47475 [Myxococcota bacterium]
MKARRWERVAWDRGIGVVASLARSSRHRVTRWLTRSLAVFTLAVRGGRRKNDVRAVGNEWQRMFPSGKMVPIVGIDDTTVRAEIHTKCPLRGTGDTAACYRMMEYDRRLLERIGGQLVVLRSQAEPGRTHCEVAIRVAGAPVADLIPAHRLTASRAGQRTVA